jgi:hypothetical protein
MYEDRPRPNLSRHLPPVIDPGQPATILDPIRSALVDLMTSQAAGPAFTSPDSDLEADLEVDQLDSDSEINEDVPTVSEEVAINDDASAALPPRTKPGERVQGHSLLSASRVENMIQADGTFR